VNFAFGALKYDNDVSFWLISYDAASEILQVDSVVYIRLQSGSFCLFTALMVKSAFNHFQLFLTKAR
jgi:hypothetical protein